MLTRGDLVTDFIYHYFDMFAPTLEFPTYDRNVIYIISLENCKSGVAYYKSRNVFFDFMQIQKPE